jgi:hypothetical protein
MRLVLNQVFGVCGYGWGYQYAPENISTRVEVRQTRSGAERTVIIASITHLEFWYRLHQGETTLTCTIPATGSSENNNDAYALKGALTNAIGNAVSNIGFQQSVYLGERDHRTVGKNGKRNGRPTGQAAADPGGYIIPWGKNQGKRLDELAPRWVEWYTHEMRATTPERKQTQEMARAFLEAAQNA